MVHVDTLSVKGWAQTAAHTVRSKTMLEQRQQYNHRIPGRGQKPIQDLLQVLPFGPCAVSGESGSHLAQLFGAEMPIWITIISLTEVRTSSEHWSHFWKWDLAELENWISLVYWQASKGLAKWDGKQVYKWNMLFTGGTLGMPLVKCFEYVFHWNY